MSRSLVSLPAAVLLLSASVAGAQAGPRLVITPAQPRVASGDSLRLTGQALDASGQPIPDARVRFQEAGAGQQGGIDSTGLVIATAPGAYPVVAVAVIPGQRPIVRRIDIQITPGPAARIEATPILRRLLAGQRIRLETSAFSAANDPAAESVTWRSSAPNVARVAGGLVTAVAPGQAILTATAGKAATTMHVLVLPATVGSVELTPATTQVRQGDVTRFTATVKDRGGKEIVDLNPTWSMSPGRGLIDADGAFVAYEPGDYVVTANFGSASADAAVSVADRDVRRKATVVGSVIRTAFPTSEVWIHPNGKVAYLGTHLGGDRFYSIDISDPAKPAIVDSVVANTRLVNDIMTTPDGKFLVFTRENADDRKNGIVICSLEDPLHPKVISEFTAGVTGGVHSTFIATQPKFGTHVYLTNDATGAMHVIDISDPYKPREVAQWKTPRADAGRYIHDIDVQDGLLYGSWWNDGLVILDVGNGIKGGTPSNPVFVSQYKYDLEKLYKDVATQSGSGFIRGTHTAWRHKNYVFIADEVFGLDAAQALFAKQPSRAYGTLQVIDVSDVTKPRSVARYTPEYGGVHNVWVAGDTLYMGAYNAGFRAFDVSGELRGDLKVQGREIVDFLPMSPNGAIPNSTMTWGVVVKNNLAFINDFNSGLWIVRMDPKAQVVP